LQADELKKDSTTKILTQPEEPTRRQLSRNSKKNKGNLNDTTAVTKATLGEEIKDFKTIVRHIFKHEVKLAKGKWIRMENRANLRRLNDLGIYGHQPAIKAYCQISEEEKRNNHGTHP